MTTASFLFSPSIAFSERILQRVFEAVEVDEAWIQAVRGAAKQGTVVYVSRSLSFLEWLALRAIAAKYELPAIHFVNDIDTHAFASFLTGHLPLSSEHGTAEACTRALKQGASGALFLKRPPLPFQGHGRGQEEGDPVVRALLDMQRTRRRPIVLIPHALVWSKHCEASAHPWIDTLFGPRECPGDLRTLAQFLSNRHHVTLRGGEPLPLQQFLDRDNLQDTQSSDDTLTRRLVYLLLRRIERARVSVLGPAPKPLDRIQREVLQSANLQREIEQLSAGNPSIQQSLTRKAFSLVQNMSADLNGHMLSAVYPLFDRLFHKMYTALEIDHEGLRTLQEKTKQGALVLLPNHKSHLDYMVLTYLFYKHHLPLPLIAAGDNLNFPPLGFLFRRAGAFFIRRSFHGDRLYASVVEAYVRRLIKEGSTLEFFLEGARSRTGKLLPPKLGLLSMVIDGVLSGTKRPVFFCPISIGYERVVEEHSLLHEIRGKEKKKEHWTQLFSTASLLREHYGRVNLQFAEPFDLTQLEPGLHPTGQGFAKLSPPKRRALVSKMATHVMHDINRVTAVTPSALVATALLTSPQTTLTQDEITTQCIALAHTLLKLGARFTRSLQHPKDPRRLQIAALQDACTLFVRAGSLHQTEALPPLYRIPNEGRLPLSLAKNSLLHFFEDRAFYATSCLAQGDFPQEQATLQQDAQTLASWLRHECLYRPEGRGPSLQATCLALQEEGVLVSLPDGRVGLGPSGGASLRVYAAMIAHVVEAYRIAARSLLALEGSPLSANTLKQHARKQGDRMFFAGEITRREACNSTLFDNAFLAFVDQGFLCQEGGKYRLAGAYTPQEAVEKIDKALQRWSL